MSLAHYSAAGQLGRHPARRWQLFAVVRGSGWVSGDDDERVAVGEGDAALWWPGEAHESGSHHGMTALIVATTTDPIADLIDSPTPGQLGVCQHPSMRIVHVGSSLAREVGQWGSHGVRIGPVARWQGGDITSVVLAHYSAAGRLGRHPARIWQLFTVVHGSGWVSGDDDERVEVGEGDAALWSPGEAHESGSDAGMTVLIVETTIAPTVDLDL